MKQKTIPLLWAVLIFSFHCYSQSIDNKNNTNNNASNPSLKWNGFENHPACHILDTLFIFSDYDNVVFKPEATEMYLRKEGKEFQNNPVDFLIKQSRFTKYYSQYANAKNEFEKKRLEKQILEERDQIKKTIIKKRLVTAGLLMKFSEYNFDKKGFFLVKSPLDNRGTFKDYMSSLDVQIDLTWIPRFDFISVNENDAERFIKDNPKRDVVVQGIIEFTGYGNSINKNLEFIIISTFEDNPYVLNVYPNITDIKESFESLEEERSDGMSGNYDGGMNPEVSSAFNDNYSRNIDNWFLRFDDVYGRCVKYGFDKYFTQDIKQIIERDKQKKAKSKITLDQFLKNGKIYNGYQMMTGNIKKNITLSFSKKISNEEWEGTCQYSNGRKSIVIARPLYDLTDFYHPCLNICFYRPDDDEIGAGGGSIFYLKDNQLIGYEMNEKLNYGTYSKTFINLK